MHQMAHPSAFAINQSQSKQNVLLDTDIGDDIDDALALALILHSPEITLRGITTVFGDTEQRARLAAHLLHTFGHNTIPIAAGIGTPLLQRHRPSDVPQAAILETNKQVAPMPLSTLSAPELIIQMGKQHFGQLTLLCIGPLTNIAHALMQQPQLYRAIKQIIMMGGSSSVPLAEWNVRSDARAAQIVLNSGIPITMIGMNVTLQCHLTSDDLRQLQNQRTPQTQLLSQLIAIWQQHRPRWQPALPYLHDPLVITALCRPELFTFAQMSVCVLTHKLCRGMMLPRIPGPRVQAATHVQSKQARRWIMQRLLATDPDSATAL